MILGITGTIGAGKSTTAAYLEKKGFKSVHGSEFLNKEAARRGLPLTRVALRRIGNELRKQSPTALIEAVLLNIDTRENIAIESLHTASEVAYIHDKGGRVISIDAPIELRWERIRERGEIKDDYTYEEFLLEQKRHMESENPDENNLGDAIRAADFHIDNEGNSEELFQKIDGILAKLYG